MADPNSVITQLAATRVAAQSSSDANNAILSAELAKLQPNAAVMELCTETMAKDQVTIQQCDKHIVTAILARGDADKWLAALGALTTQMSAQSAALTADVAALNTAKSVATAIAGMLSLIGV